MTTRHHKKRRRTTRTKSSQGTTQGAKDAFEFQNEFLEDEELVGSNSTSWSPFGYNATERFNTTTPVATVYTTPMNYNTTTSPPTTTTGYSYNSTLPYIYSTTPSQINLTEATTTTEYFLNFTTSPSTTRDLFFNITPAFLPPVTPPSVSTTIAAELNPTASEECLLGRVQETLKWADEDGALQMDFIEASAEMRNMRVADYSKRSGRIPQLEETEVLSLAYNGFDDIPYQLLNRTSDTVLYLTLAGNNFKFLNEYETLLLYNLVELDLRKCGLREISSFLFQNVIGLKYLYLSENNINYLSDESFSIPTLEHLDLSLNREDAPIQSPLTMTPNVFTNLTGLKFLDLSHTKVDTKSIEAIRNLPKFLIGVSFCYTELATSDNFLGSLKRLRYLDLSGNPQMNFTKIMFSDISATLEWLEVKDANVRTLEWTHPLTKLKTLNLKDNKLKQVDNNSFSHMLDLEVLNLSKNSIVNWYTQLFSQNQNLETLNLRENALTKITSDMQKDLLSVRHLAIGQNAFECSCELHDFMHLLFDATKNANLSAIEEGLNIHEQQQHHSSDDPTTQPVLLGVRNYRPEYDIISRAYQRYFAQIQSSVEALKKNNYERKSKAFVMMSRADAAAVVASAQTVLLDYDENNEDYQCMNKTEKELQSMLDLIELCDTFEDGRPSYIGDNDALIIALSAAIPSALGVSVLIFVIYWKWWYIRYFFVLCKNAAILSFMDDDDDDGGKETIVRRKSSSSSDVFLYDVFVSYSDQNRAWVLDEFIPNVEKRESINVCLHERDFQVGFGILENIVSCMDRSRCLLLLVSEKFLESQWCQFEMNLAQHRLLETRKEKLILVLLEDIPVRKQTKTLKYLMRTKTYIKWPSSGTGEEKAMFWKRLKKSIISSKWEYENYGSSSSA